MSDPLTTIEPSEEQRCAAVFMVTVPPGITKPMGTCRKPESAEVHHLTGGRGHKFVPRIEESVSVAKDEGFDYADYMAWRDSELMPILGEVAGFNDKKTAEQAAYYAYRAGYRSSEEDRTMSASFENEYPLAPNPVFWTIQGEGHLRGFQMCFVRLAGCSVGCRNCDTDYSVNSRATAEEIARLADVATPTNARDRWVWITGGEPTDHNLSPLLAALRNRRFSIAVATAGHKRMIPPVDWLSVSPHDPAKWTQTYGNEVKIVPDLNGFSIGDFLRVHPDQQTDFMYRYVQPLTLPASRMEDPMSLHRCIEFLKTNPNWSLSRQDHHVWGVA